MNLIRLKYGGSNFKEIFLGGGIWFAGIVVKKFLQKYVLLGLWDEIRREKRHTRCFK